MSRTNNLIKALTIIISTYLNIAYSPSTNLFVILILFFILNMQIRKYINIESLYLLSIVGDIALVVFLVFNFSPINIVLLIISLLDIVDKTDKLLGGSILTHAILFSYLSLSQSKANAYLLIFLYSLCVIVFLALKKQSQEISDLKHLNDDIRKYSYQLESAKTQIEKYSQEVSDLSKIKERNRIAEELHDSIGHQLTALLYQLEATIIVLSEDFSKGIDLLQTSINKLRECIESLRDKVKNVEVKRYKNFRKSLNELVLEFQKSISIELEFRILGTYRHIKPEYETVLYNNTREALTNIARHSNATKAFINLTYTDQLIKLQIWDNGKLTKPIIKGFGIKAMENRMNLVGGTIFIEYNDGFNLEFSISMREEKDANINS